MNVPDIDSWQTAAPEAIFGATVPVNSYMNSQESTTTIPCMFEIEYQDDDSQWMNEMNFTKVYTPGRSPLSSVAGMNSITTPPNKIEMSPGPLTQAIRDKCGSERGSGSSRGSRSGKLRTPRTLTRLMQQHRDNERHRHRGLNASIQQISQRIPGYKETGKETKIVMLQRIINYICHLEENIQDLCKRLNFELLYKNIFLSPHIPKPAVTKNSDHGKEKIAISPPRFKRKATKRSLFDHGKTQKTRKVKQVIQGSSKSLPHNIKVLPRNANILSSRRKPFQEVQQENTLPTTVPVLTTPNKVTQINHNTGNKSPRSFKVTHLSSPSAVKWIKAEDISEEESEHLRRNVWIGEKPKEVDRIWQMLQEADASQDTFTKDPPGSSGLDPQTLDMDLLDSLDLNHADLLDSKALDNQFGSPCSSKDSVITTSVCEDLLDQTLTASEHSQRGVQEDSGLDAYGIGNTSTLQKSCHFTYTEEYEDSDARTGWTSGDLTDDENNWSNKENVPHHLYSGGGKTKPTVSPFSPRNRPPFACLSNILKVEEIELDNSKTNGMLKEKIFRENPLLVELLEEKSNDATYNTEEEVVPCKVDNRKTSWMNGFMMYSRMYRKCYIEKNPGVHTSHISRMMGNDWKHLTVEEQRPYKERAKAYVKTYLDPHK